MRRNTRKEDQITSECEHQDRDRILKFTAFESGRRRLEIFERGKLVHSLVGRYPLIVELPDQHVIF